MAADKDAARELSLYVANVEPLYRQYLALLENYKVKRKKGTFVKSKAIDGIQNLLIPKVIKQYERDFYGSGGKMGLDKATKRLAATEVFEDMWINDGLRYTKKANPNKVKKVEIKKKTNKAAKKESDWWAEFWKS